MSKVFDLSLIVGRFQGLHKGHEHLINTALSLSDRVLVLLGSAQEFGTVKNPFSVTTRQMALRAIYPTTKEIIIGTINDTENNEITNKEWGTNVLNVCIQFTRKIPEAFVYGRENNENQNWFQHDNELKLRTSGMSEIKISREMIVISSTQIRKWLFFDDFDNWSKNVNSKLHKHYDEFRSELLNSNGYHEMTNENAKFK